MSGPIAVEVFSSPGCAKCLHAKTMLRALAAELGAARVIWREVDILAETERAIELGCSRRRRSPSTARSCSLRFPGPSGCAASS